MKTYIYTGVILASFLGACGKSGGVSATGGGSGNDQSSPQQEQNGIPDQEIAGIVQGKEWIFVQGMARFSLNSKDMLSLDFSDRKQNVQCPLMMDSNIGLMTQVPAKRGDYELGKMPQVLTATLAVRSEGGIQNLIITQGIIKISKVTETEVEGQLAVKADDKNKIGGRFKIPLCVEHSKPTFPKIPAYVPADGERTLGERDLKLGSTSSTRAYNELNVGEPKAKIVSADFRLLAEEDLQLSFYKGLSSGFNCSPFGIKRSFIVEKYDLSGKFIDVTSYNSAEPSRISFSKDYAYRIRAILENFPDFCGGINTSFEVYRH